MSTQPPKGNSTSGRKRGFPRTDAGNAEFFAHYYRDQLRYDFGRGRWLLWSKHWWFEDRRQTALQMAKEAARTRYRLRLGASGDAQPDGKHDDDNEQVQQEQERNQHALPRALCMNSSTPDHNERTGISNQARLPRGQ